MKFVVYLFKTNGEPFQCQLLNEFHTHIAIYGINPNRPEYKGKYEMHGKRIHQIFIDPDFQTASWFWEYYMPALHSTGTLFYDFIQKN